MKYLVLLLVLFMVSNVNAETYKKNIEDYYQRLWEEVEKAKEDKFSYLCLSKNIYGKVHYDYHYCIQTYDMLMKESYAIYEINKNSDTWVKLRLDAIKLKKHICADKLAHYDKSDYYKVESYKYFCTNLEHDQSFYEYYKNECMKNRPVSPLVCFSYKFE